jgi:transmembrane sensor
MSELTDTIARARGALEVDWTPERERLVARRLMRRMRRRTAARLAAASAALTLAVVAGAGLSWRLLRHGGNGDATELRFADGSTAALVDRQSLVVPVGSTPDHMVVAVARGGARFDVAPQRARRFRVEAGAVAVEVLGTRFTVLRVDPEVVVSVERGRVRVIAAGAVEELGAGERAIFPRPRVALAPAGGAAPAAAPAPEAPASAAAPIAALEPGAPGVALAPAPARPAHSAARRRAEGWRALAQEGDYDAAFEALGREGPRAVRSSPDDLLLAADAARLSRHPRQAVEPLRRLVREHARDPRATLAAFTLGRLLLDDLGDPRQAAGAFARVQELDPSGQLAQDALGREVEAWAQAGEVAKARERALRYLERYPDGRRVRAVRRHGGLE